MLLRVKWTRNFRDKPVDEITVDARPADKTTDRQTDPGIQTEMAVCEFKGFPSFHVDSQKKRQLHEK